MTRKTDRKVVTVDLDELRTMIEDVVRSTMRDLLDEYEIKSRSQEEDYDIEDINEDIVQGLREALTGQGRPARELLDELPNKVDIGERE